jgi:CBS domain containing-hemolysin-like protein
MLDFFVENGVRIVALGVLLVGSAFFSGAETALFNLTRHQLNGFRTGLNPMLRAVSALMQKPDSLLVTLMLGNMTINVLFFAIASVLVLQTASALSGWQSTLVGFVPLMTLIFFGEVLPKIVAVSYPRLYATVVAGPLYAFHRINAPVRWVFQHALVSPGVRLLSPSAAQARPVEPEELQALLAASASQGHLAPTESLLLHEVIELGTVKVREIALPRVDMKTFDIAQPGEAFLREVKREGVTRWPVYQGDRDNIVGILHARDVLLDPVGGKGGLEKLVRPVWFVPEMKRIDSLLREFQQTRRDAALAVDEYGAITGMITLEDIVRELVGGITETGDTPESLVRRVDDKTYAVSGRLSIREWAQAFGLRPGQLPVNTVGGLIVTRLGRLPKLGDAVRIRNVRFVVTRMEKHRVVEAKLELLEDQG